MSLPSFTRLTYTSGGVRNTLAHALFSTQSTGDKVVLIDGAKTFEEVTVSVWVGWCRGLARGAMAPFPRPASPRLPASASVTLFWWRNARACARGRRRMCARGPGALSNAFLRVPPVRPQKAPRSVVYFTAKWCGTFPAVARAQPAVP